MSVAPAPLPTRLRASPAFALALMPDGRPFVTEVAEPYRQYWLDEPERQLLAACGGRHGCSADDALARCGAGPATPAPRRRRLQGALRGLLDAGVLEDPRRGASRYAGRVVQAYRTHRPFPPEVADTIVRRTRLTSDDAVLDLAGGPGDLALQLARHTPHVSLMDWSGDFLAAARRAARAQGLQLHTLHESCNRLAQDDSRYTLVTVAQALHWLDDLAVCRGVARALQARGHFCVVHSALEVDDRHPLAHVLGPQSVLGAKPRTDFGVEAQALHERVSLLLRAVQAPGVDRVAAERRVTPLPAVGPAGIVRWRQRRPFGPGFVQALLSDRHLADAGLDPAGLHADVRARCQGRSRRQLTGTQHWVLLHYARGAQATLDARAAPVRRIGCSAPD